MSQFIWLYFMYIGRFAPSPTGALHFGSLLAALASYLDAKHNFGLWLLRIDDLDPPREMSGASECIIKILGAYGLKWDEEVVYQSQRYPLYQRALEQLKDNQLAYPCSCSRKDIQSRCDSLFYDKYCLKNSIIATNSPHAWRFNNQHAINWIDGIQGKQSFTQSHINDFILQRKDDLWAYQLAVAVDDEDMGITHIVRGEDLLSESANQLLLNQALNYRPLNYSHIPVVTNNSGQKLSKQNLAKPLSPDSIVYNLYTSLCMLGQKPDKKLLQVSKDEILHEATLNWQLNAVPLVYSQYFDA